MLKSQSGRFATLSAFVCVALLSLAASAQDTSKRGRKYTPPPDTAHISVSVVRDTNGKPVENAAVVFHMVGEEGKGNMELKTNEQGKAIIDVIPIGDTVTLQVIANGFQTYGEDYKITSDAKDIVVRLKRPVRQYSTYEHPSGSAGNTPSTGAGQNSGQNSGATPAPKQ
jgi:hypothetical protein